MTLKVNNHYKGLSLLGISLILTSTAGAQNVVARNTLMKWESLYGGGPTGFSPSDTFSTIALESSFLHALTFEDDKMGDFPLGWTASVAIELSQQFEINGPIDNFSSISAQLEGFKTQSASGIGSAGISSVLPGNELSFQFTVDQMMNYNLSGSWESTVANSSFVKLDFWNGSGWANIHSSLFLFQGVTGSFDWTGQLNSGTYRLLSQNELYGGDQIFVGQNNYTFTNLDAVPEPGTIAILSALAIGVATRKRRNH